MRFQFLIGRLETSSRVSLQQENKFQFLIGRLETVTTSSGSVYSISSFNSS